MSILTILENMKGGVLVRITYRPLAEIVSDCFGIPVEQAKKVRFNGISPPFIRFISEEEAEVAEEFRDKKDLIENAVRMYREKVMA